MAGKLEKNGFWESSRMMLPQHKEQSLIQDRESYKRTRPTLDPEEQELILQEIGRAMHNVTEITITVFGSYGERTVTGVPVTFNQYKKVLKLATGDEFEWVPFDDILGASSLD